MKILINNLEWNVLFVERNDCYLQKNVEQGYENLGLTDPFINNIYINKELSQELQKRVLTHEITHAFLFSFGFDDMTWNEEELCNFVGKNAIHIVELMNEVMK